MSGQKVEIKVDAKKLNVFVILNEDGISEDDIIGVLKSSGIKTGIMHDKIKNIVKKPVIGEPLLVAQGIPAIDGKDAIIEHKLTGEVKERRPVVLDDGSVNYKDVKSYNTVSDGEILAVKHPSTKGKSGIDVFGNEIPAKDGKDVKLLEGKNTKLVENGMKLIASKSGIPILHDNMIEVSELLEIKGDVDYSTGNIDFPGDVHIRGGVKPTFIVRAEGNVKIDGVIEAATVLSNANVECLGVKGRNKGVVSAKGDIHAKFLENANIECKGSVYVDGSIVNSAVRAGKMIKVEGRTGEVVSSNLIAGIAVIVKQLGAEMSSTTHVEVGVDPELREKINELSAKIYIDKENLSKVSRLMKVLEDLRKKKGGVLPPDKEETYNRLKKTRYALYEGVSEMVAEAKAYQEKLQKSSKEGYVRATSKVYSGIEIKIGEQRLLIDKDLGPSEFKNIDDEISITPYVV